MTLRIDEPLEALASPTEAAAAGTAAALAGALAAAVVAKAARVSERHTVSAQALALQQRLLRLADDDAAALGPARAALSRTRDAEGDERLDFQLGALLRAALTVPYAIGEACADVAQLAGDERDAVAPDFRADLAGAASVAAGAAQAASQLVAVNLAATPEDVEVVGARAFASRAAAVVAMFDAD